MSVKIEEIEELEDRIKDIGAMLSEVKDNLESIDVHLYSVGKIVQVIKEAMK